LPADLAPPGDIAIARENFRRCFSIVEIPTRTSVG
jgi:hypothetical protein